MFLLIQDIIKNNVSKLYNKELLWLCGQRSGQKVKSRNKYDFRCENSLLFVRRPKPLLWNKQHYSDLHYHVSDKRLSSVFSQLNNCHWYFSISMATLTLKAVIVFYVRPRPLLQLTAEISHWRGNQKKPTFKWGIRGRELEGGVLSCNTFCCGFPVSSRGKERTLKWRHMWCS